MTETTCPKCGASGGEYKTCTNSEFFGDKKYVADMFKNTFEMGQQHALIGTLPMPNFDAAADHLLKCLAGYTTVSSPESKTTDCGPNPFRTFGFEDAREKAARIIEARATSEAISRDRAEAAGRPGVASCRQASYEALIDCAGIIRRLLP